MQQVRDVLEQTAHNVRMLLCGAYTSTSTQQWLRNVDAALVRLKDCEDALRLARAANERLQRENERLRGIDTTTSQR